MSNFLTFAFFKIDALEKKFKVIQGGQGASKTYSVLQKIFIRALKENIKATVVTETYPLLKDGVIADMESIFTDAGLDWKTYYNSSDKDVRIYGSIIQFRNIDNKDFSKAKGVRRDILYINEADRTNYPTVDQLITRSKEIYIDFNPDREFWVHTEIVPREDCDFIVLTYLDNQRLSKEEREEIEKRIADSLEEDASEQLKNWVRIYAYGEIGTYSDRQIYSYRFYEELPEAARQLPSGMDFGLSPDPSVLYRLWVMDNNIYVKKVFKDNNLMPEKIKGAERASLVDKLEEVKYPKGLLIVGDSANRSSILDIRKNGYTIVGVKKPKGSVTRGISRLRGYNLHILVEDQDLKKAVESFYYKQDRNGKVIPEPDGHEPDELAAIRYSVMTIRN